MKKISINLISMTIALAVAGQAAASMVQTPGGMRFNVKVKSLVEMRYKNVVRQARDLSCGAAALATLFKYYYSEDIDEKQIIDDIFKIGDKEKIQKDGFSMLELKRYGDTRGYVAKGFRIPKLKSLNSLRVPVLTLITTRGYSHFVVIKAVKDGRVFIADPAFGNVTKPLESFGDGWSNVILVFLSKSKSGDQAFKKDETLRAPKDQIISLLDRGLFSLRPGIDELQ